MSRDFSPELAKALDRIATQIEAFQKAAQRVEIHVWRRFLYSSLDIKIEFKDTLK